MIMAVPQRPNGQGAEGNAGGVIRKKEVFVVIGGYHFPNGREGDGGIQDEEIG